jgi:hypothetical protein
MENLFGGYIPQEKTLNPQGVLNPQTGKPYVYASGAAPVVPPASSFLNSNNSSEVVNTNEAPKAPATTRSKYIDPKTGQYFKTAEEYGNYVATKIPVSGDIPKYAGDAMTDPNQSATNLEGIARNLNNARNDIAVGQTDPYGVGNKSGIAYSPAELKAIEKAYAGVYDPALNDVFARLKEKQTADAKAESDRARREEQIFTTNENIRQWKATTGSKGGGSIAGLFTQTQLNNAARNSGLDDTAFSKIDDYDLINFFVQPPSETNTDQSSPSYGKATPLNKSYENLVKLANAGDIKPSEAAAEIESSNLPESVKHYYLDRITTMDPIEKQSWLSKVWGAITGK